MKRKLLTVAALLSFAAATHAQQVDEKRHYLSLAFGASVPFGGYGASSNIEKDGYATLGRNIGLDGAFFINKNIGIGGSIGATGHPVDADKILTEINKDFYAEGYTGATQLEFDAGYLNSHAMIGPAFTFPYSKVAIDLRGLVGPVSLTVPEMTYTNTTDGVTLVAKSSEAEATAFGYDIGFGVRCNLSNKLALRISGDFIGASEMKLKSTSTLTGPGGSVSSPSSADYNVSYYNFGVGLAYQFGQ